MSRSSAHICRDCLRSVSRYGAFKRDSSTRVLRSRYSTATGRDHPIQLAIIGSGPAGFYSAYRILKSLPDARIDMYEKLPSPYGLVRYGIAPDHPEAKKCSETLPDVAKSKGFQFIGNTPIGHDQTSLPLTAIAPHYDAMLFAYGASEDRRLGIPGEDLRGVYSARSFVGWYNGLPEHADLAPDLTASDTAVLIGQGNVALDVTRILLAPLAELRRTDIAEHAVAALSRSRVRSVKVVGRRGPLQAPYTIKELRELMHLPGLAFAPPPEGWDPLMQVERKRLPRQLRRIAEVLERGSPTALEHAPNAWQLGYLRTPIEFLAAGESGDAAKALGGVAFETTEYTEDLSTRVKGDPPADLNALRAAPVRGTGKVSALRAGLAFRSVGYKSLPLDGLAALGVPFDGRLGIIPNDRWGRVLSPDRGPGGGLTAGHVPGMYCAGWVKRGPTGVIASTLDDAFATADVIVKDWQDRVEFNQGSVERKEGYAAVRTEIEKRGIRRVSWEDWEKIDAEEIRRGKEKDKEREKCRSVGDMLKILDG